MTAALPVLIAGGGIGGLATAIGLARRGIPTKVLERRVQFSEAGAGIQIGPNGVRALRHLGIDGLVQPYVATPRELIVHAGRSGRVLARLPLGDWIEARHGAPYWAVHRADLQTALLARLAREPLVEIVPAFDVGRFEIASGAVHVQDPHGRTASGGALIGADGQFSQIRQQLPDAPALRLSGRTAARTVIEAPAVSALLPTHATCIWLAPRAHVVHYPIRQGRQIAVVVIFPDDWHDRDWDAPLERDRVGAILTPFAQRLRRALGTAGDWRRWALWEGSMPAHWASDRVALLGDAAHPILPFLAQGGGMALEDAVVLSDRLAVSAGDIPGALRDYAQQRIDRVRRVVAASRRNGRIYHLGGLAASVRNAAMSTLRGRRLISSYDWLYGWQPPAEQGMREPVNAP